MAHTPLLSPLGELITHNEGGETASLPHAPEGDQTLSAETSISSEEFTNLLTRIQHPHLARATFQGLSGEQREFKEALLKTLGLYGDGDPLDVINRCSLSKEEVDDIIRAEDVQRELVSGIPSTLTFPWNPERVVTAYNTSTLLLEEHEEIRESVLLSVERAIAAGAFGCADYLIEKFSIQPESVRELAAKAMVSCFEFEGSSFERIGIQMAGGGHSSQVAQVIAEHYLGDDLTALEGFTPEVIACLREGFEVTTLEELVRFKRENQEYVATLLEDPEWFSCVDQSDLPTAKKLHISLLDLDMIYFNGVHSSELGGIATFEALLKYSPQWEMAKSLEGEFREAAEVLGADRLLWYLRDTNRSSVAALHGIHAIVKLYHQSGLSLEAFTHNILSQVKQDGHSYSGGSATQLLKKIGNTCTFERKGISARLSTLSGFPHLQQLAKQLSQQTTPFQSWAKLRQYAELEELALTAGLQEQLQNVVDSGDLNLVKFIDPLIGHPGSKIDLSAVQDLITAPEAFFSRPDSSLNEDADKEWNVSNLFLFEHLDLTPEDLRTAWMDGTLDATKSIPPFRIRYEVNPDAIQATPHELLKRALGSSQSGDKPLARNSGKLFHSVKGLLSQYGVSPQQYISEPDCITSSPLMIASGREHFHAQLREILFNPQFGIPDEPVAVIAEIHLPSDPLGVIAANDITECALFGVGKTNSYTVNPSAAFFTVRLERPDGSQRTFAQSVLTRVSRVPVPASEQLRGLIGKAEASDEIIRVGAKSELALDNLEVHPNYREGTLATLLPELLSDFFGNYQNRLNSSWDTSKDWIPIGEAFSSVVTKLPRQPNNFLPEIPIGYSDNYGESVIQLKIGENERLFSREVGEVQESRAKYTAPVSLPPQVSLIEQSDWLAVRQLERIAYTDNPVVLDHEGVDLFHFATAVAINNHQKGRPSLLLKHTQPDGELDAFLLAYEGRDEEGNPLIVVSSFASSKRQREAAIRLSRGFEELLRYHYLSEGGEIRLELDTRQSTSARFFSARLHQLANRNGFRFHLEQRARSIQNDEEFCTLRISIEPPAEV